MGHYLYFGGYCTTNINILVFRTFLPPWLIYQGSMDAQGEEKCKDHSMRNDRSREKNKHGPPLPFWKYDIMHAVPLVGMQLSQPTAKINALASGYCSRSKGRLYKDSQWLLFSYSCGAWYKFTSISIAHAPDEYSPTPPPHLLLCTHS